MSEEIVEKEMNISEEDKIAFFKCFLGDTPYEEEYSLFDGKFKIVFRTMTTKQTTDVFNQLRQAQINSELTNDPNYIVTLTNFRLGLCIVSIDGVPFATDIDEDTYKPTDAYDSYIKAKAANFKSWPIFKLSAIVDAFKKFEHKVVALTDAIQTENFWIAAK